MKLGIVQGRLSPPVFNHIQEFPFSSWEIEFELLRTLSLEHIEWIVTKSSFKQNPLFYRNLRSHAINSICADNIIDMRFYKKDFLELSLKPICEAAVENNIKNLTIPLLEQSSILLEGKREMFIENILIFTERYPQLNFSFETEGLSPKNLKELVYKSENFFITYDTGNITSSGDNHSEFLKDKEIVDKINNVHLKDRTYFGVTAYPGTGDTNFSFIFKLLKEQEYNGAYTLQAARDVVGREREVVKQHMDYLERIYDGS